MAKSPEQILALYREFAEMSVQAFSSARAECNPDVVAINLEQGLKSFLMQGLICWRCGLASPVQPFQEGMAFVRQGYAAWEQMTGSTPRTLQPGLEKALFVAFLVNESAPAVVPQDLTADRLLDAVLGNGLHGKRDEEAWSSGLAQLRKLPGSALAVESYTTYQRVLGSSQESEIRASIEKAVSLFEKRKSNVFYSGGEDTDGGGRDNAAITVDYRLAALMKKLGHKSDSVHGWQWG